MGVTFTNSSAATYEAIQSQTMANSSTSTVTFNPIPQTYTDLILIIYGAATVGGNSVNIKYNNDATSTNYGFTQQHGNGSVATTTRRLDNTGWVFWSGGMSTSFDNVCELQINNYASTFLYKQTMLRNNTASVVTEQLVGCYKSTNAISRIDITAPSGAFSQNSIFTLYGIKAA